jgi:hypothetical protein
MHLQASEGVIRDLERLYKRDLSSALPRGARRDSQGDKEDQVSPDPVEQTITKLCRPNSPRAKLIRYLAEREGRRATLEEIVTEFRKLSLNVKGDLRNKRLRNARRTAEKLRRAMEGAPCPLRLRIKECVVRLYDPNNDGRD